MRKTSNLQITTSGTKRLIWAVTVAAWSLLIATIPSNAEPIRIGVSLPLGSNASKLADQFSMGMEWYLKSKSLESSYKLIVVDDGCDKDLGLLAAEDLSKLDVSLVLGYFCSETAAIAAEIFAEKPVPILVNVARSNRLIDDRNKEGWNLWRVAPGDDYPAIAAFEALSGRWRNTPYAVVDDGTIYGRSLIDEFRIRMEEAKIPPLYIDNFRASQSTQAGLIRRLQRSGVKAIFVGAAADDLALVARNVKDLGADFEIVGGEVINILPYLFDAEPVPAGLLAILQPEPDLMDSTKDMVASLLGEGISPEPYFFKGYAAMELADQALKDGKDNVMTRLNTEVFQTIYGPVEFDESGKNIHNRFSLYRWNGASFVKPSN